MLLEDKEEVWMEKAERLLEGLEENKKMRLGLTLAC